MATAYTSLLGLALPVTGELSGTWGNTVNTEITSLLDSAIAGTTTISADADITLTTTTGAANESREAIILWTAGGTATRNITAPAQSKAYIVINKSSSTQSIVLRGAGPTTGVTIIKGEAAVCAWNGSDFIKVSNISGAGVFSSLTVTGTTTLSGLTASTALALDASKNVVSVTNTGTGNNVLATSPTLVTPALGTPSALVGTNITGTATSFNINGTVGATTPTTGSFTSLDYSTTLTGGTGIVNLGSGQFYKDASGNVGIGTSSPSGKLHSYATSGTTITVGKFEAAIGSYTGTSLIAANTLGSSSTYNLFSCITDSDGDAGGPFTQFLVRGDGNVGIGTSSPDTRITTNLGGDGLQIKATSSTFYSAMGVSAGASAGYFDVASATNMLFTRGGTESMRIDSSGNVGIGTSSPIQKLDVNSIIFARPSTTAGSGELVAAASDYSSLPSFTNTALRQYGSTATGTFYGLTKASLGVLEFVNVSTGLIGSNSGAIAFATSSTERMRIDSSGNVGIGTTSPAQVLEVSKSSNGENGVIIRNATSGTTAGAILRYYAGTDTAAIIRFPAGHSTKANELFITNVGATSPITFATQDTERMRIDSDGRVLINKTSNNGTSLVQMTSPASTDIILAQIGTNGGSAMAFLNSGGAAQVGNIVVNVSSTAYNTSSDYRLKEAIAPMTGALAKVALLKPCTYKWKVDGSDGQGFIAHELDEVVPGCVTGEKDAVDVKGKPVYQGIDTSFLVATLTAAIQEQQALITSLAARIAALEST